MLALNMQEGKIDLSGFRAILTPLPREKSGSGTINFSFCTKEGLNKIKQRETAAAQFSGFKAIALKNHPSKFEKARRSNLTPADRANLPQLEEVYEQALQELKTLLQEHAVFSGNPDLLAEAAISALAEQGDVSDEMTKRIRSVCQTQFKTEEGFSSKYDRYGNDPVVGFMLGNSVLGGFPVTFISEADLRQTGKNMDQFIRQNCRFLA